MKIEAKEFELEMTYEELWSTAFEVLRSLEGSLERHWINHQTRWKDEEQGRLNRLRSMFYALGRPDLYEQIFSKADNIFNKFNNTKC